jgi:hypothetical protein
MAAVSVAASTAPAIRIRTPATNSISIAPPPLAEPAGADAASNSVATIAGRSRSVARGTVTLGPKTLVTIGSATTAICHIVAPPPRSAAASALQNDLEFLILGPTTTPTRIHHFEPLDLGTAPITVHKDSTQP